VSPVELDASFDLSDGLIDQTYRSSSVSAFIFCGGFQFSLCGLQGVECRLHVRLICGFGFARKQRRCESGWNQAKQ
jgi:hypothetical protein